MFRIIKHKQRVYDGLMVALLIGSVLVVLMG